jgi:hypothetical protein
LAKRQQQAVKKDLSEGDLCVAGERENSTKSGKHRDLDAR